MAAYGATSKSMMFAIMPALEVLAERGYEVIVITPFKGISKGNFFFNRTSAIETDMDAGLSKLASSKRTF